MNDCGRCGCAFDSHSWGHKQACLVNEDWRGDTYIRPSRSHIPVEPDYRLCRWCGIVRNLGRDECPPSIRSMREVAMAMAEARATA